MRNRARTLEDIFRLRPELLSSPVLPFLKEAEEAFKNSEKEFRFAVTPYYLSLASTSHLCPIWRQILPQAAESQDVLFWNSDPLAEESHMPVPGLTHRYPDRVLWYISHNCAVYCRFCMRKRKVSRSDSAPSRENLSNALSYIHNHSEIQEVILSGGDPLSQSDAMIESILAELKSMEHLFSVRIHSRMPVTCPQRITDSLCEAFRKHGPITFITHFNHSSELTGEAKASLKRIKDSGTTVLNQSVLLAGINDTVDAQKDLLLSLVKAGAIPYYLHQCDEVKGVSHFRVDLRKGLEIQSELRGRIPGISIPEYVIDLPGGGGKVPVNSSYFVKRDFQKPVFENYEGRTFSVQGDND